MSQTSPCSGVAPMYLIHCRAKSSIMCSSCNHVQWTQYVGLHHVAKWPSQEHTLSFKIRLLFCTCSWLREVFSGGWLHELYSTFSSCSVYLWVVSSYEAISFWAQRVLAEERLKGSGRHSRTVISTDWSGYPTTAREILWMISRAQTWLCIWGCVPGCE